jgi:hypothetical protein
MCHSDLILFKIYLNTGGAFNLMMPNEWDLRYHHAKNFKEYYLEAQGRPRFLEFTTEGHDGRRAVSLFHQNYVFCIIGMHVPYTV